MVANIDVAHISDSFYHDLFELCKEKLKDVIVRLNNDGISLSKGDVLSVYENELGETNKDAGNIFYYKIKHRTFQYRKGELIITYWLNDVL